MYEVLLFFVDCCFVLLLSSKGLDGLKEKYSQSNEYLKVDRLIFIASANNSPLPTRLMEAVRNTARKENRGKSWIDSRGFLKSLIN